MLRDARVMEVRRCQADAELGQRTWFSSPRRVTVRN